MGYYDSYQIPNFTGTPGTITFCDQTAVVCLSIPDSEHRTICQTIRQIDCSGGDCPTAVVNNGLILCTEDTGWNCNLCANDLPYNSPVDPSDTLYFQFQQIDNINTWTFPLGTMYSWGTGGCDVFMKDCCTGDYLEASPGVPKSLISYCGEYFIAKYPSTNNLTNISALLSASLYDFQGIKIPLSSIHTDFKAQFPNSNCFYLEFTFNLSGTAETLYTETYEFVNCKNTLLISSDYTNKDCDGYWYNRYYILPDINPGLPPTITYLNYVYGTFFYYKNEYRVPAYLERRNFQINKQFVGNFNRTVNSQMVENWKLLTERIPEKVALIIAKILSGSKVYIGNGEFTASGVINKNNDVGNQWFLDADISRTNCSKTFSCN